MREGPKTFVALLAVLLLAMGLAACGSDDDSTSSTQAEAGQTQSSSDASKQRDGSDRGESKSDSADSKGDGQASGSGGNGSSNFVPKQHKDSGGGSQQLKVKGGDNSVQEFGAEADPTEFARAATAFHNFFDARAEGNWAAACEYLSKDVIASFEKLTAQAGQVEADGCGGVLEKLTNPAAKQAIKEEAAQADVGSLRIEGERAFVIYTDAEGTIFAIPMANEDGTWKVASLAGTPLS